MRVSPSKESVCVVGSLAYDDIALKTIERLKKCRGLRGFEIGGSDPDAILEIIDKAGLGSR